MGDVPTIAAVDALCASAIRAVPAGDAVLRARLLAELWSHVWLVDAAFQAGDLAAVDYELGRIEQLAIAGRHGLAWWHLHRLRASRAALTGELDAALAHDEQAREVAVRIGATRTTGMYYAFLGQIALLRGTIDRELAEATIAALRQVPEIPLVRVFMPMAYALLGERDLARATFEEFRYMPGTVEVGPRWAALLAQIGAIAAWLGDAGTAERVYQEFAGLTPGYMGDGSGAVFCGGSMQRLTGDFALAAGRVEEAVGRYTDAIEMNARIGARPFLALSRLGLARALVARALAAGAGAGAGSGGLARARALVIEAAAEFRRLDLPGPLATADALIAEIDAAAREANPLSPPGIGDRRADRQRHVQPADRAAACPVRAHRGSARAQHPGQARLLRPDRDRDLVAAGPVVRQSKLYAVTN